MPNWVDIKIEFKASEEVIDKILADNVTEGHWDFNGVHPIDDSRDTRSEWGVKWNADDCSIERLAPDHLKVSFQTPWNFPTGWWESFLKRYQGDEILYSGTIDEEGGFFHGEFAENGEKITREGCRDPDPDDVEDT